MRSPMPAPVVRAPLAAMALAMVTAALPSVAHASFLPPELMDKAATYIAWFVICVMPIGAVVLFWMVHVLPEKIAHKRHHPQRDAIHTLCLLSLVFGGLLWPLAWLWAYTKPVLHKMAYGTDVDESLGHHGGEAEAEDDVEKLRARVVELETQIKGGKA